MHPSTTTLKCCYQTTKRITKKWSGNCGFVNEAHYSPLLAAFSHWSYVITENYLIVVDLQCVDRENKYTLTDPSIHCQDPKFGNTNLGKIGIEQFFKTHKCSEICAAMRLPKNKWRINSKTIQKQFKFTIQNNRKMFLQI